MLLRLGPALRRSMLTSCVGRGWARPCWAPSRQGFPAQRQLAAAAGAGGSVQPPDVPELARLAHIAVTDEEVKDWAPKIEGIVEWFGQLQEVDVEGVPPALRAEVETENFLRADTPVQYEAREQLVEQFPLREGSFNKVPKIATEADA